MSATFRIDNYKILNKAPGPEPYFYTPSNYKSLLQGPDVKAGPMRVTAATPPSPAGH